MRIIGWIFLAITLGAFVQSYFIPLAQGAFVSPEAWMHPHAVVSFAFAALFVAQPWLILKRNQKAHRVVGWILGALVAGAVVSGVAVQFEMWPTVPEDTQNRIPASFRLFQLLPTLAGFFVAGVLMRKRPDWHWRFMLHAAYAPVGTAVGRFVRMIPEDVMAETGPLLSGGLLLGIIVFLICDKARYGRVHAAITMVISRSKTNSRRRIGASRKSARAIAARCCWPPDNCVPPSPR